MSRVQNCLRVINSVQHVAGGPTPSCNAKMNNHPADIIHCQYLHRTMRRVLESGLSVVFSSVFCTYDEEILSIYGGPLQDRVVSYHTLQDSKRNKKFNYFLFIRIT